MVVLARKAQDTYMELIQQLPLVPIRDDRHLEFAQQFVDGLLQKKLDNGGAAYLKVLSDLIADYEDEHHPIEKAAPSEILQHLMEARGISREQLINDTGIGKSAVSQFLSASERSRRMPPRPWQTTSLSTSHC